MVRAWREKGRRYTGRKREKLELEKEREERQGMKGTRVDWKNIGRTRGGKDNRERCRNIMKGVSSSSSSSSAAH